LPNSVKKWFMLQVWRIQQIAQILSLVMLAITDALLIYDYSDGLMFNGEPLIPVRELGVLFVLFMIGITIWVVAIIWDLRLKMWREQATVLIDRNPYAKEKMTSKEITVYELVWFPIMERLAKDDPKMRESLEAMKRWVRLAAREQSVAVDARELMGHIGMSVPDYVRKDGDD
jgi:hypothetical protein